MQRVNRFPSARGDFLYFVALVATMGILCLLSWALEVGVFSLHPPCPEGSILSGGECYLLSPPDPPRPEFLVRGTRAVLLLVKNFFGAGRQTCTADHLFFRQMLYYLSYPSILHLYSTKNISFSNSVF